MSESERHFINSIGQPQGRFTVEQVAWALNFQPYEILSLVTLGLLIPIGNPAANAIKYFYADEILALARDRNFLKKATNAMYQARAKKNHDQKLRIGIGNDGERPQKPVGNGHFSR
jgi:hypothetical protein